MVKTCQTYSGFRAETGKYYEADDWSKKCAQEMQKI